MNHLLVGFCLAIQRSALWRVEGVASPGRQPEDLTPARHQEVWGAVFRTWRCQVKWGWAAGRRRVEGERKAQRGLYSHCRCSITGRFLQNTNAQASCQRIWIFVSGTSCLYFFWLFMMKNSKHTEEFKNWKISIFIHCSVLIIVNIFLYLGYVHACMGTHVCVHTHI